jgi:allantoicase
VSERWIGARPDPRAQVLAKAWIDLAHPRLGSATIATSDDFFAPMARLIDPAPPVFVPGKYDDNGKWMDGWESRRKRGPGHDWCILRLGHPGRIHGVDIDTSHFTGNYPPAASLEAWAGAGEPGADAAWTALVPRRDLQGDAHQVVEIADRGIWSHLRLNIFPDGGVARLRVYGEVHKDWSGTGPDDIVDLAALVNGAKAVIWNDAHYGVPSNMLAPTSGADMGDGWETRRRREPGNDWAVIALGHAGTLTRVIVDTAFFKGNYPDRCSLQGARLAPGAEVTENMSEGWQTILPERKLGPDREHAFVAADLAPHEPVTHVRLNILPDGGVMRLRLFGRIAP